MIAELTESLCVAPALYGCSRETSQDGQLRRGAGPECIQAVLLHIIYKTITMTYQFTHSQSCRKRAHAHRALFGVFCVVSLIMHSGSARAADDNESSAEAKAGINTQPALSQVWKSYAGAKKQGHRAELIDYSYVGYHRGEKAIPDVQAQRFDVTKYGAVANDGKSDKKAIQKAVDAAGQAGGGVVVFPAGRFLINEASDDPSMILRIQHSKVVLRGAGCGPAGTELMMSRHLPAKDPQKMWSTPYMVQVSAPYHKSKKLAVINAESHRDTKTVYVDATQAIEVGDWVVLRRRDASKKAVSEAVAPYPLDPAWTSLINSGVQVTEFHQVKSLTSKSLTFYAPVHYALNKDAGWTVESYQPISEVGVEDIAFVGNWKERFVHHKSAVHDGGWSLLSYANVVDGWVRRCRFTDVNNALTVSRCSNISALELSIDGNKGHAAVAFRNSSHCLGALIVDRASQHHACGVGGMSSGNVFWRINYPVDTCFEAHASQPRHTLFDQVTGGFIDGRWGGAAHNQPNHLEGLVLWNYHNLSDNAYGAYEFVKTKKKYGKIIMPQVIGFHGGQVDFVVDQIKTLESLGQPVAPDSLYAAQLHLRLGRLPEWLVQLSRKK